MDAPPLAAASASACGRSCGADLDDLDRATAYEWPQSDRTVFRTQEPDDRILDSTRRKACHGASTSGLAPDERRSEDGPHCHARPVE
jgi:hypothetical protein